MVEVIKASEPKLKSEAQIDITAPDRGNEFTVVYAVGDIHGRLDLLDEMNSLIAKDIASSGAVRPVICYLGDYVDRGPHSAQVLERLSLPFADHVKRIFLKGNHEDRMIKFLVDPVSHGASWMNFGGREALESYGVRPRSESEETSWTELRDRLDRELPQSHKNFLNNLALSFRWRDFLFVHAGVNPERPLALQTAHDLMWIREPFLSSENDWGYRIVHGHVIVDQTVFRANRIGIDTGAYASGRLTCLVVGADEERVFEVRRD